MKTILNRLPLFILLILGTACTNSEFSFKKVSEYRMDTAALPNHSHVRVLYSSGGPDFNKDEDYYYQFLVAKEGTHDTVRLLCTGLIAAGGEKMGNMLFMSAFSKEQGDMLMNRGKYLENKDIDPNKINDIPLKKIEKVVSNKKYAEIENHNFPTVIGTLVTETDTAKIEKMGN